MMKMGKTTGLATSYFVVIYAKNLILIFDNEIKISIK